MFLDLEGPFDFCGICDETHRDGRSASLVELSDDYLGLVFITVGTQASASCHAKTGSSCSWAPALIKRRASMVKITEGTGRAITKMFKYFLKTVALHQEPNLCGSCLKMPQKTILSWLDSEGTFSAKLSLIEFPSLCKFLTGEQQAKNCSNQLSLTR